MKARIFVGATTWLVLLASPPVGTAGQDAPAAKAAASVLSWTSDVVTVKPGDLITILVDEYTVATADLNDSAVRQRDRDLSLGGAIGGFGARTNNDVSSRTQGGSARRERFSAEITARVVEMLPGGLARVEGSKTVRIDDHEQEVTIKGIVRPQDISIDNTIESWRVAEAEIFYEANGSLGKAGGFWSRLLDLIIP